MIVYLLILLLYVLCYLFLICLTHFMFNWDCVRTGQTRGTKRNSNFANVFCVLVRFAATVGWSTVVESFQHEIQSRGQRRVGPVFDCHVTGICEASEHHLPWTWQLCDRQTSDANVKVLFKANWLQWLSNLFAMKKHNLNVKRWPPYFIPVLLFLTFFIIFH